MINGISTEQFGQEVPNFVEQYASQLAEARDTEDGRVHLGAEAARQVMEEQGQEQAGSVELFEPPLSPAGDEGE